MSIPTKIFLSYSHQNRRDKDILIEKLAVMIQNHEITVWHDDAIIPGEFASQDFILEELTDCDIFLFLLSSASLASNNCNLELESAVDHNMPIISVLLESCDWENHKIVDRPRILPLNAEPIKSWNIESEAWQNVVKGIRIAVNHHQEKMTSASNSENNISVETLLAQGSLFISSNLFDMAIEVYTSILELYPNYAEAYNQRGYAFQMKGEYDRAIADYCTAIGNSGHPLNQDCDIITITLERRIRWRNENEETSPPSLKRRSFLRHLAVKVRKQNCVGAITSAKTSSPSGSSSSLKMRPLCLPPRISNPARRRSGSPTSSTSLGG